MSLNFLDSRSVAQAAEHAGTDGPATHASLARIQLDSCSPANLQSVPNLGWTLSILIPVQILLGLIILRRRNLHGGVK